MKKKESCLLIKNPELCKEWNYKKNENLSPENFTVGSNKRVWWICSKCGYEWETEISSRHSLKRGCAACCGQVVTEKNSFAFKYPEIAKEWHPTKNGKLTPRDFSSKSGKKVWWLCSKCGYEWETTINSKTTHNRCASCSNKIATARNCLEIIYPEIAKGWHPSKNDPLTPKQVTKKSSKKVWWLCHKCGHEWAATISSRARGNSCPGCSGQSVTNKNCLENTYPEIAKELHPTKNDDINSKNISYGSNKKVWWLCSNCGNEWQNTVIKRTLQNRKCKKCKNNNISSKETDWILKCKEKCTDILTQTTLKLKKTASKYEISIKENGETVFNESVTPKKRIYIKTKNFMKLDGISISNKLVFEFLGDYWHGNLNSKKYKNKFNNNVKKSFKFLQKQTYKKFEKLAALGFTVIYRWESEDLDKIFVLGQDGL